MNTIVTPPRNRRKAFTIVELIIVIAVIGVLAAILIPTFANVIRKANIAKDVSLCKNMTTALAITASEDGVISVPQTIDEVLVSLLNNGYDMSQLKSKTDKTAIYWIKTINRIVLVDKSEAADVNSDTYTSEWAVLWPKELADVTGTDKDDLFNINTGSGTMPNFFALSHNIQADLNWIAANQDAIVAAEQPGAAPLTVTVNSADQLAALSLMIATPVGANPSLGTKDAVAVKHATFSNVIIQLTGDIYLGNNTWSPIGAPCRKGEVDINGTGTMVTFSESGTPEYRFNGTFDGQSHTIAGLSMSKEYAPDCVYENRFALKAYTFGLFGSTYDATIKNLNMAGVNIDNRGLTTEDGHEICGDSVGAIVGLSAGTLTIENCTVSGQVISWDCAGGIVARHYGSGNLTVKNCTNNANVVAYGVDNTGGGKKAGGILGYAGNDFDTVTFENLTNNGNVSGGTAGGMASYISANQASNRGTIVLRNCTNNGKISNSYNGQYYKAGGAGGIFGSSFRANSKTDISILENLVNNGEIDSMNGTGSYGIMSTINSPVLIKGRIENTKDITNIGSTAGATGLFLSITADVTVDSGAVLKNTGDVYSDKAAYGIFGSVTGSKKLTINGKIEQRGDITSTTLGAYGVTGDISALGTNVTMGANAIITQEGDITTMAPATYNAYGIFGNVSGNANGGGELIINGRVDQRGNVISSASKAFGVMGAVGITSTVTINANINVQGQISSTLNAYGLMGDVQAATVSINGGTIKISGDILGDVVASGVMGGINYSGTVASTITIAQGASVEVSGDIIAKGNASRATDTEKNKAWATGFASYLSGVSNSTSVVTPTITINGTFKVTSSRITAITLTYAGTASGGVNPATFAVGLVGYVCASDITFGAASDVRIVGTALTATAKDANYVCSVLAAGVSGHVYGGKAEYHMTKIAGNMTMESCTLNVYYTASAASFRKAEFMVAIATSTATSDLTGLTVNAATCTNSATPYAAA